MTIGLVLTVGDSPRQLDRLNMLMRAAGHIVESAVSIVQAAYQFLLGDFDLVLVCPSVPPNDRARLISAIRASGSSVPVFVAAPQNDSSKALKEGLRDLLVDVNAALRRSSKSYRPNWTAQTGSAGKAVGQHIILCLEAGLSRVSLQRSRLEQAGFLVLAASSIAEAVELCSLHIPDAVLVDEEYLLANPAAVEFMYGADDKVRFIGRGSQEFIKEQGCNHLYRCLANTTSPQAVAHCLREVLSERQILDRDQVPGKLVPPEHRSLQ